MRAVSVVEVRLAEAADERLVALWLIGGEEVVRLRAPEARNLAVRLLEVAYLVQVSRPGSRTR